MATSGNRLHRLNEPLTPTIVSLYEAVGDSARWPAVLEQLSNRFSGRGAVLFALDPRDGTSAFSSIAQLDVQYLDLYNRHYVQRDPRIPRALALPVCTPVTDAMVVEPGEYERSEFYCDFLRPQGLRHVLGSILAHEPSLLSGFGIQRGRTQTSFDATDRAVLGEITPHLQRALRLHLKLGELAADRDILLGLLEQMTFGVVLLGAAGQVLHLNTRAQDIVALRDGLAIERGELVPARSGDAATLRRLIQSSVGTWRGGSPGGLLRLARPSARRPFQVLVTPFPRPGSSAIRAAAFLTDPEARHQVSASLLRQSHGLTVAEAKLAARLAAGETLAAAAGALRVTDNTARTQLKKIFEKTGTSRQSDFLRLVYSGPLQL